MESYKDALNKKFEDWSKDGPQPPKREIESTTDGEGGVKIVKFKPRDEWSGAVEVRLKQFEGAWKIVDAGYWQDNFDKAGNTVKEFVSEPDVYNLSWR